MATAARARGPKAAAPAHLWIVGILALLWNALGCFDYFMTETHNQAYLAKLSPDQLAYMDSLPAWLTGFWAIGVWCGLAGALLLLMRSPYAVWAFALSLVGAAVTFGFEMFATAMPASMKSGAMAFIPWLIVAIAIFLLWYARGMEKKGVLR